MTEPIHDSLDSKDLLPGEHVVDAGYTCADLLLDSRARGVTLLTPTTRRHLPQARTGVYTTAAFTIDWDTRQATCPQGATSTNWSPCTQRGTDAIVVKFDTATCQACPATPQCTTATRSGRQPSLRPRHVHEAVARTRAAQTTDQRHNHYKTRAGVEPTTAQTTHLTSTRRTRYLGLPKTTLEHHLATTAINLIRHDA